MRGSKDWVVSAEAKKKQGDYQGALADYDEAVRLDPNDLDVLIDRGDLYAKLDQLPQAFADYNEAIRLDPTDIHFFYTRGGLYYVLGESPQLALADFNEALRLDPHTQDACSAIIFTSRGDVYADLNQPQQALADYNEAIRLNPNSADAFIRCGVLYRGQLKQPQWALENFNQAIRLEPANALAFYNRGNLYQYHLKQPQQALADYNEAIRLDPTVAAAFYNRGDLYQYDLKQPQLALADYNEAIRLDPTYAAAFINRGNLYRYYLKQPQQALADYNEAIRLEPRDGMAFYNRGLLYHYDLKQPQQALADFYQALRFEKDSERRASIERNFRTLLPKAGQGFNDPAQTSVIAARAALKHKQSQDALGHYDQALGHMPGYLPAVVGAGEILCGGKGYDVTRAANFLCQTGVLCFSDKGLLSSYVKLVDKVAGDLHKNKQYTEELSLFEAAVEHTRGIEPVKSFTAGCQKAVKYIYSDIAKLEKTGCALLQKNAGQAASTLQQAVVLLERVRPYWGAKDAGRLVFLQQQCQKLVPAAPAQPMTEYQHAPVAQQQAAEGSSAPTLSRMNSVVPLQPEGVVQASAPTLSRMNSQVPLQQQGGGGQVQPSAPPLSRQSSLQVLYPRLEALQREREAGRNNNNNAQVFNPLINNNNNNNNNNVSSAPYDPSRTQQGGRGM